MVSFVYWQMHLSELLNFRTPELLKTSLNTMHILVSRFSAFGDVAMTVPVLWTVARCYPQHRFTVLSRESMRPLFLQMPDNVAFCGVDLKAERYKGPWGMVRLYRELRNELHFDAVADLHDVLRTKILRTCARLNGLRVACIDKGRGEKKQLTRPQNKVMKQLSTSFDHYRDVFASLGLPIEQIDFTSIYGEKGRGDFSRVEEFLPPRGEEKKWVGIAPFAAHQGKIYPLELMEQVVARLDEAGVQMFLFGAGDKEVSVLRQWADKYPHAFLPEGLRMERELILMSHLDAMVSMDSANMHLASLVHTPVVSIWGATHPYCGFMGYGQRAENAVQVDDLACRPCSVFGNKPCLHGDYRCLTRITPEMVVKRVLEVCKA